MPPSANAVVASAVANQIFIRAKSGPSLFAVAQVASAIGTCSPATVTKAILAVAQVAFGSANANSAKVSRSFSLIVGDVFSPNVVGDVEV